MSKNPMDFQQIPEDAKLGDVVETVNSMMGDLAEILASQLDHAEQIAEMQSKLAEPEESEEGRTPEDDPMYQPEITGIDGSGGLEVSRSGGQVTIHQPAREEEFYEAPFDRYLHIADAEDWCTLDSSNPTTTGHETAIASAFYTGETQYHKRALVRLQQPIGLAMPFERLVIDAADWGCVHHHFQGEWDTEYPHAGLNSVLYVRAITCDFDPETLTWNTAYVTDGGSLTFGSAGSVSLFHTSGAGTGVPLPYEYNIECWSSLNMVFPAKNFPAAAAWNGEKIYGFEIRIDAYGADSSGSGDWWMQPESDVTFAIDNDNYDTYIIRAEE